MLIYFPAVQRDRQQIFHCPPKRKLRWINDFFLLFGDELIRQARKGGSELHYNAYGIEE